MNRITHFAVAALALGAMATAQAPAPPAPPAPPALKTRPAVPPKPPKPPQRGSYLGVEVRDVTHERMAALNLKEPRGVEILMVDRDAPAGKAGLKEHDVVLSFNGRAIQNGEELRKLIRATPPGQTVELGISRDGQLVTVKPQLADRAKIVANHTWPNVVVRIPRVEVPTVMVYRRQAGIVVENLTPQLGEAFGVKNGEGVLVRSVEKGSPGEAAGLRAGDVIVRVGTESVADSSDWNHALGAQKPGPVQLGIVREKRPQSLSLTLPEGWREQSYSMPGFTGSLDLEEFGHNMLELQQRMQPEVERAVRDAQEKVQRELERSRRELQREMERHGREMEQAQREAERAQREAQRAREQAQREAERAQREAQREQERATQQAQREVERAKREAQREAERAQREAQRQQEQATPPEPPKPPQ